MCLKTVKKNRKFIFYDIDSDSRKKILHKVALALGKNEEIIFAVVYGGFLGSKVFRDIDIAIFTGYKVPYEDIWSYTESLAKNLKV
ncbi:MAG: hypothetical protein DRJ52_03650 [Thermoprotei archaeon]|nr:MAG: hypothetical protein DRJ52_03650 [Thermoprotei archaeon]RLF00799.1 MAG: hypothetical protein DRJ63_01440 [Thermoprotei archaeon]HDI74644.1 hypothetical protein [Thermoprotei archaeon]